MIEINDFNESYIKLSFDSESEFVKIRNYFAIKIPGVEHTPQYKAGMTDGKKYFLHASGKMLFGLKSKVIDFLESSNIQYKDNTAPTTIDITDREIDEFIECMNFPFTLHDFQIDGIKLMLKEPRSVILAATSAGKSCIVVAVLMFLALKRKMKCFVIVPEVGLVEQLYGDFKDYFYSKEDEIKEKIKNSKDDVEKATLQVDLNRIYENRKTLGVEKVEDLLHKIYGGQDKHVDVPIRISTFQSVYKEGRQDAIDPEYFEKVDCILYDEAHRASATTVQEISTACVNAKYKLGCTGTLKSNLIEQLTLEGTIGPATRIVSARELIDRGLSTETIITPIQLIYSKETIKEVKKMKWAEESKFVRNHEGRLLFLSRFILSLAKRGNTIAMFVNIDLGKALKNKLEESGHIILYVDGEVSGNRRQEIKKITEENDNVIIVGSFKTIGTGVNIKNLQNMVFTQSYSEPVIVLQALGRMMRKHSAKRVANVYDVVDYLVHVTKSQREYPNYLMKHFNSRLEAYYEHEFTVAKPIKVELEQEVF